MLDAEYELNKRAVFLLKGGLPEIQGSLDDWAGGRLAECHGDLLGQGLVEGVKEKHEELVGIVGNGSTELLKAILHRHGDHVAPEGAGFHDFGFGRPGLEDEFAVGFNHARLVGRGLLFQEGFVVLLEKEESQVYLVAEGLDYRIAVAGISNICQASDAFARRLRLRLRCRRF